MIKSRNYQTSDWGVRTVAFVAFLLQFVVIKYSPMITIIHKNAENSLDLIWAVYHRSQVEAFENSLKISTGVLSPYWLLNYVLSTVPESEGAGVVVGLLNARYYDGNRGQFLSEDPVFWSTKQNLEDPQSMNSYSYANNNPINRSDQTGLAATIQQQIQILEAQVKILTGIINLYKSGESQQANNVLSVYQTSFGGTANFCPINANTGNSKTPSITVDLTKDMVDHSSDFWINNPLYFRDKVKNGGDWDLKNQPEYDSKKYNQGFIFQGQHIDSDAPGNIHYGYVGSAAFWSSPEFLLEQAGKAQVSAGTSNSSWQNSYFHGDDPIDQINILWGASLYFNR